MAKTRIGKTLMGQIDFNARYEIDGWRGIAWYLDRYETSMPPEESLYVLICDDEECDHDKESCYLYDDDPEPIVNQERVIAVMVGDDREFNFGIDEILRIEDEDYCPGCGQIGCRAFGFGRV